VRRTYDRFDRVIVLSQGAADDLVAHVPSIASKIRVIYNAGVDDGLAALAAQPIDAVPPRPLIVACGRLAPQKGYPDLLDAFTGLRRELGAHLWIVGEGPQRAELERTIAARGLGDVVRLLGFQKNPYAYMAAADVFVLSSLYEGFGNVIVEAMATGRPVVSTDGPSGPAEIITDGENGLLVPVSDAPALASAIRRVLTDPALAQRLGAAGRRRADDFHIRTSAAAYADVFREVASARHAA
jgi:glycosyltransferase involved in cell wall biosynthesis